MKTLIHGGQLANATETYGIPRERWLDISTGISPWSWPTPLVPESVWQRLPEADGNLEATAAQFYGCSTTSLLPVPGSQYAISKFPHLLPAGRVALPLWGYEEHRRAWESAGHEPAFYDNVEHLQTLITDSSLCYAVVINPGNPSAELIEPTQLQRLAETLAQRSGHLLVDEAFMDCTPNHSLAANRPGNVTVLKSVGKFFGLAGIRLGFVITDQTLLSSLEQRLDPWAVNHPARWLGERALSDTRWIQLQRQRLIQASSHWGSILANVFPRNKLHSSPLFVSLKCDWQMGKLLFDAAARQALLLRLIGPVNGEGMIRFGIPTESNLKTTLARLRKAVSSLNEPCELISL